jgi:hypothetical protein
MYAQVSAPTYARNSLANNSIVDSQALNSIEIGSDVSARKCMEQ